MDLKITAWCRSACLESIHCGSLVILCHLWVKKAKINMPLSSYSRRLKTCWLTEVHCSKLLSGRYQKQYAWCWVTMAVKCLNKNKTKQNNHNKNNKKLTSPTNIKKVFPILFRERHGCEFLRRLLGTERETFLITVVRKKGLTCWRCFLWRHLSSLLQLPTTDFILWREGSWLTCVCIPFVKWFVWRALTENINIRGKYCYCFCMYNGSY